MHRKAEDIFAGGLSEKILFFNSESHAGKLSSLEGRLVIDLENLESGRIFSKTDKPFYSEIKKLNKKGIPFSHPGEYEIHYGEELLKHLHYHDKLRLTQTEDDAVRLAARIAQKATERDTIVFIGTEIPNRSYRDTWNALSVGNLHNAMRLLHQSENKIAAIVINPILSDDLDIIEGGEKLKDFISALFADGALLILNERHTGFRLSARGFGGRFYVKPDMSVYAGIPCGAASGGILSGTNETMVCLEENPELGSDIRKMNSQSICSGLAAIRAFDILKVQPHFVKIGATLQIGLEKEIYHIIPNLPYEIQLMPLQTLLRIVFLDEPQAIAARSEKLHRLMLKEGFFISAQPNPLISFNFSITTTDVENFIAALKESLIKLD